MNADFAILAAVATCPAYPYALLGRLQRAGIPVTRSTLYRRIESLLAEGVLQYETALAGSANYRRVFALSSSGRERVEADAVAVLRSEPLESPSFALAVGVAGSEADSLAEVLMPRMSQAARMLTAEERLAHAECTEASISAARQRRIAHLQADIAWLQGMMRNRVVARTSPEAAKLAS